jgi:hypothetical protein
MYMVLSQYLFNIVPWYSTVFMFICVLYLLYGSKETSRGARVKRVSAAPDFASAYHCTNIIPVALMPLGYAGLQIFLLSSLESFVLHQE